MTAKEFIKEQHDGAKWETILIEFAKYHVGAFKKEIDDRAMYMCSDTGWDWCVDTTLINKLYPLEKIK